jgi:hypothetical protein
VLTERQLQYPVTRYDNDYFEQKFPGAVTESVTPESETIDGPLSDGEGSLSSLYWEILLKVPTIPYLRTHVSEFR